MNSRPQADRPGYVTVRIYDQDYYLSGQDPEHVRHLAGMVDAKMRSVSAHSRTADSLRVAVLAALNLADDLDRLRREAPQSAAWRGNQDRIANLRGLLDQVLDDERMTG